MQAITCQLLSMYRNQSILFFTESHINIVLNFSITVKEFLMMLVTCVEHVK